MNKNKMKQDNRLYKIEIREADKGSVAVRSSLAHFQWLFSDCLTGSVMVSSYIWLPDKTSWVAGGQAIFEWKYMFFNFFQQQK